MDIDKRKFLKVIGITSALWVGSRFTGGLSSVFGIGDTLDKKALADAGFEISKTLPEASRRLSFPCWNKSWQLKIIKRQYMHNVYQRL